jgi:hypothetical protein
MKTLPILLLSLFSIFSGLLLKDAIVGIGSSSTLSIYGEFSINSQNLLIVEYTPMYVKCTLMLCSFSGYIYYAGVDYKERIDAEFKNAATGQNPEMKGIYSFFTIGEILTILCLIL